MRIEPVDFADPGDRLSSLHAIVAAHEPPGPVSSLHRFSVIAQRGWSSEPSEVVVARLDGEVAGGFVMWLPKTDNTHLAHLRFFAVHPARLRRGVGSALLEHALVRAEANGRRLLLAEALAEGPGAAFARAHGFQPTGTQARRVLDVTKADLRPEPYGSAYELDRWRGPAPEEYVDDIARLNEAMNDAPTDEMDIEGQRWDRDRVRALEANWREAGQATYTTVARHRETGRLAGFTQLNTEGGRISPWGRQTDTAVLREHRGHRLGLAVKVANTAWFIESEPQVRTIATWNAVTNSRMIAINERMGFRLLDIWHEWERKL
ncbi:GNAT family N-acetyltransferase [Acrocarpospora catenulata]|uniref:GNAT family N-acetyltransferase n=1 Tax=Acrocarpospora catenulata TaxID=2836182 RepID=UPI001BD9DFC3|nr:GNAT family N-acetyltransferase [Acrocarpospora catenulata]